MFTSVTDPIKITISIFLGLVVGILVMILVYEGVSLPLVGQVINGRLANAVDTATETMVTKVERDTLTAQLAEEKRRSAAAAQSLEDYRKRLAAAEQLDQQQSDQREQEILAYELRLSQANRKCMLDRDDLDFLRRD
jgi:DNA anti-recombination protein RmuC